MSSPLGFRWGKTYYVVEEMLVAGGHTYWEIVRQVQERFGMKGEQNVWNALVEMSAPPGRKPKTERGLLIRVPGGALWRESDRPKSVPLYVQPDDYEVAIKAWSERQSQD